MALLLAVFFSSLAATESVSAGDSSLISLEAGISDLTYALSRSLVTVESFPRVSPGIKGVRDATALLSLVASGLILDSAGHILVAAESIMGRDQIWVGFEERKSPAQLLATDYVNGLALLRISDRFGRAVEFSNLQTCAGQMVVAMGNAYGLRAAPQMGMCAGVRDDGNLQFSVPVSSGAIGGGVFDFSGRLLGMIVGSIGDQERAAVAFPAHRLREAADYMLINGDRYAGFVGIRTQEMTINPPLELSISRNVRLAGGRTSAFLDAGVLVTSILPASPASRAGLKPGDLIYAIGNRRVQKLSDLSDVIRRCEPGMTVNVELVRDRTSRSLSLVIGRRQTPPDMNDTASAYGLMEQKRVADSVSRALDAIRKDISRLERRLQGID